ncbi:MAG: alpha/beta fold hydrolase [Candidatus Acidiferrales bacterium]
MTKAPGIACVCLFLCVSQPIRGQAQSATAISRAQDGEQQLAALGDLKLQSGGVIHDFHLGYRTFGTLNATKSNAVLWPSWLGGTSAYLVEFITKDKIVDPAKYFVILVDAIGDGISTSPSNSKTQLRMQFPEFTIRDMVESEHRLASEVFHLTHFRAVMGVSMGGMQTFEWAEAYPDFMDLAIPITGSPQSTSYDKLLWTSQIAALKLDPEWQGGDGTMPMAAGFAVLNEIGSMALSSPAFRVARTPPQDFDAFIAATRKEEIANAAVACDFLRQRQAIMSLDVPGEFGLTLEQAAKRVHAKMLVIISPEDHMVNPAPALAFAEAIGAPVVKLDSPCGHITPACISIGPTVAQFLADPRSVQSATLH